MTPAHYMGKVSIEAVAFERTERMREAERFRRARQARQAPSRSAAPVTPGRFSFFRRARFSFRTRQA